MTIEQMKWALFRLYPLGDWQANVDSWNDSKVRRVYYYHLGRGDLKTSEQVTKEYRAKQHQAA